MLHLPDLKREKAPALSPLQPGLQQLRGPDKDHSKVEYLQGLPSEPDLQAGDYLAQSFLKDGNQGTYPDDKLLRFVFQSGNLVTKEKQPSASLLQLVVQAAEPPV